MCLFTCLCLWEAVRMLVRLRKWESMCSLCVTKWGVLLDSVRCYRYKEGDKRPCLRENEVSGRERLTVYSMYERLRGENVCMWDLRVVCERDEARCPTRGAEEEAVLVETHTQVRGAPPGLGVWAVVGCGRTGLGLHLWMTVPTLSAPPYLLPLYYSLLLSLSLYYLPAASSLSSVSPDSKHSFI